MNKKQKSFANVSAQSEMTKMQFDRTALKRLFSYMKAYKGQLTFVVICILLSAVPVQIVYASDLCEYQYLELLRHEY